MRELIVVVVVAAASLVPRVCDAQEHFGDFIDDLTGTFNADAKPRPTFRLGSAFRFNDPNGVLWAVPAGVQVDGASIPQLFWSLIGGPFEGAYIKASVIHDYYCDTKTKTAHDTHRNFFYGMLASGVERWKAKAMYWAVDTFGPQWKLEKRVVPALKCVSEKKAKALTCSQNTSVEDGARAVPPIDLNDPRVLALALSKLAVVVQTLKTTDGATLDVTATGPVEASLDNIRTSAESYRNEFARNRFEDPRRLGLLAEWTATDLDSVQPWASNKLPNYKSAVVLNPATAAAVDSRDAFKLVKPSDEVLDQLLNLDSLEVKNVRASVPIEVPAAAPSTGTP